jgi:hypothetical protein
MKPPDLRPLVVVALLIGLLDAVVAAAVRSVPGVGAAIAIELVMLAMVLLMRPAPEVHIHIQVAPGVAVRSDPDAEVVRL